MNVPVWFLLSLLALVLLLCLWVRYLVNIIHSREPGSPKPEPETWEVSKLKERAADLLRKLEGKQKDYDTVSGENARLAKRLHESEETRKQYSRVAHYREEFNRELRDAHSQNSSTSSNDRATIDSLRQRNRELERDNNQLSTVIKTMKSEKEVESTVEAARAEERLNAEARTAEVVAALKADEELAWMNRVASMMSDNLRQQLLAARKDHTGSFGMAEIGSTFDKLLDAATMTISAAQEENSELRKSTIKESDAIGMLVQIAPAVAASISIPESLEATNWPAFEEVCKQTKHILDQQSQNVAQALAESSINDSKIVNCKHKLQLHIQNLQRQVKKLTGDLKLKRNASKRLNRLRRSRNLATVQEVKQREDAVKINREVFAQQQAELNDRIQNSAKKDEDLQKREQAMQAKWNEKEQEIATKLREIETREVQAVRQGDKSTTVDQPMQDMQSISTPSQTNYQNKPVEAAIAHATSPTFDSKMDEAFEIPVTPAYNARPPVAAISGEQEAPQNTNTFPDRKYLRPTSSRIRANRSAASPKINPEQVQGFGTNVANPLPVQSSGLNTAVQDTGPVGAPFYVPIFPKATNPATLSSNIFQQAALASPPSPATAGPSDSIAISKPQCQFKEADGSECKDPALTNWSYCVNHKWVEEGEKFYELHSSMNSSVRSNVQAETSSEREDPQTEVSGDALQFNEAVTCLGSLEDGSDCPRTVEPYSLFCSEHEIPLDMLTEKPKGMEDEKKSNTSNYDMITPEELEDELNRFLDEQEEEKSENTAANLSNDKADKGKGKEIDAPLAQVIPPAANSNTGGNAATVRQKPRVSIFMKRKPTARAKKPA